MISPYKKISEKAAVGTTGFIMRSGVDSSYFFRVYDQDGGFKDYDILHYDMEIKIVDDSAVLVEHDAGNYIDYSATVLGYPDEA